MSECQDTGCYIHVQDICGVKHSKYHIECPCRICLVKMMCVDACPEFKELCRVQRGDVSEI